MRKLHGKILLALLPLALPAAAQQGRYSVPGGLAERRLDQFETLMEMRTDARWRLGFLDVEPRLAISDLGYVSNIYSASGGEDESDFRAAGRAGLRGFFNLGPKVVVSPFADLSYTWWQDQEELRSTNESFGVQLLADFNRLRIISQAGQSESQRNLSSELEVPVDTRDNRLQLDLEVDFWGPFRFSAGARAVEKRYSGAPAESNVPGLELASLEVDTESVSAGIGYELPAGLEIEVGVESVEARYPFDPGGRSNEGTGPLARVRFDGSRLFLEAEAAWRDLEFDAPGAENREELRGIAQLEWRLSRTLSAGTYVANQLQASALDSESIFEGRRNGWFLQRRGINQGLVRLFYESGTDDFSTVLVDDVNRSDDFEAYGVQLNFSLTPRLQVDLGFFDSRRESTDPQFDRDFSSVRTAIRLGGDLLPW